MHEKYVQMYTAKGITNLNVKIKIKVYFPGRTFIQAIKKILHKSHQVSIAKTKHPNTTS